MMYAPNVLYTNLVDWLKDQARLSFVFDRSSKRYHVNDAVVSATQPVFSVWSQSVHHLCKEQVDFPNLLHCLMFRKWNDLLTNERQDIIEHIDATLSAWGYNDFQFLDHGGRAMAFRTAHRPSGERRVLRIEAPHEARRDRPVHPTVAKPHHAIEGAAFDGIKIEICDEFVPLNKLPDVSLFYSHFYSDFVDLAHAANMTYPQTLFDRDAEPQNVGLSPDAHILTFDPQIITGEEAMDAHRHFKDPYIFRDASSAQLRLVYGHFPFDQKRSPL